MSRGPTGGVRAHNIDPLAPRPSAGAKPLTLPGCRSTSAIDRCRLAGATRRNGATDRSRPEPAGTTSSASTKHDAGSDRAAASSDTSSNRRLAHIDALPAPRPSSARHERRLVDDLVDEATADGGTLGAHAKRLERFAGGKRTFGLRMANFLGQIEPRRAVKCAQCANVLHFRHWLDHDRLSLAGGYFCGQWKLCLTCAIKRGAKGLSQLVPMLVDQLQANPRLRAFLVTTTTKDAEGMTEAQCRERFEHLRAAQRRYLERRNDTIKKRRAGRVLEGVEANKADGIYWSFEGGRGANSGGWHWHCHALWLGEDRPSAHLLRQEWKDITGDSDIVHVREFDCTKRGGERTSDAIARDVVEVCKYTLKPHEMTPADAYAAHVATAGKHFVGRIGTLRLSAEEREAVMAKHSPELTGRYVDLFYRWCDRGGRYQEQDLGGIPTHLRIVGGREVNQLLGRRDRREFVERLASRPAGAGGAPPELDTRTILGDTGDPHDPGPPIDRGRKLASAPSWAEDAFAG